MLKRYLFTPFFISLLPLLNLYLQNLPCVLMGELIVLATALSIITCIPVVLFSFVFKDISKGVLCSSYPLLFFFYLHHILETFNNFTKSKLGFIFFRMRFILFVVVLLFALLFYKLLKTKKPIFFPLTVLTIIFGILTTFSTVKIIRAEYLNYRKKAIVLEQNKKIWNALHKTTSKKASKNLPDIYFIILDSYTSNKVLLQHLQYDNQWFAKKLRKKGFYIAEKSHSNYPCTTPSLSSCLNMRYHLPQTHFRELIDNNVVFRFLRMHNYSIFNIKSSSAATRSLGSPKTNILSYIQKTLFQITSTLDFFYNFVKHKTFLFYFPKIDLLELKRHKNITITQLKELKESADLPSPKFVFCHLLCPHPPFVFGDTYAHQITFINKQIDTAVAHILKNSKTKPIIILQGDHGYVQDEAFLGKSPTHNSMPKSLIKQAFSILNAWYLPAKNSPKLYASISPVNNFRLIFDHYFQANLGFLKDHSFLFKTSKNKSTVFKKANKILTSCQENDLIDFTQFMTNGET